MAKDTIWFQDQTIAIPADMEKTGSYICDTLKMMEPLVGKIEKIRAGMGVQSLFSQQEQDECSWISFVQRIPMDTCIIDGTKGRVFVEIEDKASIWNEWDKRKECNDK